MVFLSSMSKKPTALPKKSSTKKNLSTKLNLSSKKAPASSVNATAPYAASIPTDTLRRRRKLELLVARLAQKNIVWQNY